MESAQAARGDVPAAMWAIISGLFRRVIAISPGLISQDDVEGIITNSEAFGALESFLALSSNRFDKPLVLMIDEVDSLIGDTVISLLRQIRVGYPDRPTEFPSSEHSS